MSTSTTLDARNLRRSLRKLLTARYGDSCPACGLALSSHGERDTSECAGLIACLTIGQLDERAAAWGKERAA